MSSLMFLNSSYHMLKLTERNLDAYKSTMDGNILVPPSKAFVERKIFLLAM